MSGDDNIMLLLGGIATDVKHILTRQDRQDLRIDRHESRMDKALDAFDVRVRRLEAFRWKVAGIAVGVPVILTALGVVLERFLNG